jgi:hypothetical protein
VFNVEERHAVTAILVLYGLPRDYTASILAHEALHAYIRLAPSFDKVSQRHGSFTAKDPI